MGAHRGRFSPPPAGSAIWSSGDPAVALLVDEVFEPAAPATVQGTLAATEAADALAGSGTVSGGASAATGALAAAEAADTFAAAGASINRAVLAAAEGSDTFAAAGASINRGVLAAVEGSDTLAAAGVLINRGALAATEDADTFDASGGVASTPVVGVLDATEAPDVAESLGRLIVAGDLAAAEAPDTAAIAGHVLVAGALAVTEEGDTLDADGAVRAPLVEGVLAATDPGDSASATGTVGTLSFTLSAEQALLLQQLAQLHGLIGELEVSAGARRAGDLTQQVAEADGTVTVQTTARGSTLHASPGELIEQLAALHGLTVPLQVTATSRVAGALVQRIESAGGTTWVRLQ